MKNYAEMSKPELLEACKELNIVVLSTDRKETILAALLAHVSAESNEENKVTVNMNPMRKALAAAHETGNKKAIALDTAMAGGATEEDFQKWVDFVQNLRNVTVKYIALKHKQSATEKELNEAKGKIYPAWRAILKVGEESKFHKNMFVRTDDISSIIGYAEIFVATSKGTVQSVSSKITFRRQIESLIGCRMAANDVMMDADRDTLKEYYSAKNSASSAEKRLNGSTNDNGEHTPGLVDERKRVEQSISDGEKMLRVLGVAEEEITKNPLLTGYRVRLKELNNQITQAKKTLKDSKETMEKLADKVEQIENNIHAIEL